MALSDKKILEEMERGDIIIEPFKRENLSTSSYDLTLGEYYFAEQPPERFQNIFNIYEKDHVEKIWGTKPLRAKTAEEVFRNYKFYYGNILPKDKVILLAPGETILAHTNEFIGGRNHITTMMKARSSLGRSFIEICKCAGWGDVGYINRWTMEITNNSRHYHIPLVVGRRVAQLIFFETGKILDKDYSSTGAYQNSCDLKKVMKNWKPTDMLPRLYHDVKDKKK